VACKDEEKDMPQYSNPIRRYRLVARAAVFGAALMVAWGCDDNTSEPTDSNASASAEDGPEMMSESSSESDGVVCQMASGQCECSACPSGMMSGTAEQTASCPADGEDCTPTCCVPAESDDGPGGW
jgi:hypothetical protein